MSGKMSIEQHRARLQKTYERWLHEVWGNGNVEIVDEVLADSFVDHRPIPRFGATREGHKRLAADWHVAFPDMKLTIEAVVIEGNRLVGRYWGRGTHRGVFAGIPATGAMVSFTEVDVIRFEGDRIAEWWHNEGGQPLAQCIRLAACVA